MVLETGHPTKEFSFQLEIHRGRIWAFPQVTLSLKMTPGCWGNLSCYWTGLSTRLERSVLAVSWKKMGFFGDKILVVS